MSCNREPRLVLWGYFPHATV
ncbi:hypothetical protein HU200_064881 [Digitaria exilis]|uniref:Uncharacterized protein n=1 Tax=Digitaria exilis TaxID=1010633 RepID=A0A835A4X2_9POAL|nr:hypothetical protein HU200_064881 [Digitaria exilis]